MPRGSRSSPGDDLGGLIREESLRRWVGAPCRASFVLGEGDDTKATMQVPFVHQEEPHSLSSLGRANASG